MPSGKISDTISLLSRCTPYEWVQARMSESFKSSHKNTVMGARPSLPCVWSHALAICYPISLPELVKQVSLASCNRWRDWGSEKQVHFPKSKENVRREPSDSACLQNSTMATSYYSHVWRWQVLIWQNRAGVGRHGSSPGSATYEPWGLVEPSITWGGTGCSLASPPVLTGEVTCWFFFFFSSSDSLFMEKISTKRK